LLLFFLGVLASAAWAQIENKPSFPRFNFDAGGGYGIGRGAAGSFAGNSFFGEGGAGVNFSRIFGFNAEYMYYDLTVRPNVALNQGLQTTSGALHAVSLNGIVRPPVRLGRYSAYGIFGVGFYDRRETSSTAAVFQDAPCRPVWVWWDIQCNPKGNVTFTQSLGTLSKVAGGYNFGGGITYDLNRWHKAKVFGEFRYHKAYQSDVETIVMPISVGLRW
jgi:opacity protein-like surface antigen